MAQRNTPPNFKSFFESVTIDASGSLIVSTLSASYASSSGAGFPYIGYAELTGSLDISENLYVAGTASFAHLQVTTASIIYESGSTKFGDSADDTHQITGSLLVSGSIVGTLVGTSSVAVSASYASYAVTASYISGSVNVDTGSLLVTASLSGSSIEFTKGDGTTFTVELPETSTTGSKVFEFTSSLAQWDMQHNFNQRNVSVTLFNQNYLQIGAAEISASDANNVSAYFTYPVSGYALVLGSAGGGTTPGTIESASYAATASLAILSATASYVSGSILNYPDPDGTTPTIQRIVSITSASYSALATKDANTVYMILE